jgi:Stage II sporulation protein E (SpoIIE)
MDKTARFWKTIPRRSFLLFLLGVFFIFSTVGFVGDISMLGRQPVLRFVITVIISGLFPIFYAGSGLVLRGQFWKACIPIFIVHFTLLSFLADWLPELPRLTQMGPAEIAELQTRLSVDDLGIILAVVIGYICFVIVSVTEFRRYFRVHAEMELAKEIHRVLVPAIEVKIGDFEFYGRSLPSGEVGGDLIDVFETGGNWIAYIADVSGHGVAPGVVMAMVKSAARMQLSSGEKNVELRSRLNAVLYPIKKPDMFVTFAYLAWNGERLEFSLAGHPAILHYRAAARETHEVSCSNLPLGILDQQEFVRGSVQCETGDVLLMLTDGLLEVANAKQEEFGLARVKEVFSAQGGKPMDAIFQAVLDAANGYGQTADDQSMLLVRCHGRTT